jgi:hypothetical protein
MKSDPPASASGRACCWADTKPEKQLKPKLKIEVKAWNWFWPEQGHAESFRGVNVRDEKKKLRDSHSVSLLSRLKAALCTAEFLLYDICYLHVRRLYPFLPVEPTNYEGKYTRIVFYIAVQRLGIPSLFTLTLILVLAYVCMQMYLKIRYVSFNQSLLIPPDLDCPHPQCPQTHLTSESISIRLFITNVKQQEEPNLDT